LPVDLPLIHDAWIALLVGAVADIQPLPVPLISYRQHANQQIGSKPRRVPDAGLASGVTRSTDFAPLRAIGHRVEQRILQHRDRYASDAALSRLQSRLAHLDVRDTLSPHWIGRFRAVSRELFTGRYHRYSRGWLSAAKDVLRN
jgi:hypothetical protein